MIQIRQRSDIQVSSISLFFMIALLTLYPLEPRIALFSKLVIVIFFIFFNLFLLQKSSYIIIPLIALSLVYSSVFWSVSPTRSFQGAIQVTYYLLIFLLFRFTTFTNRSIMWGIRILVLVSCVLSIDGVYQYVYGYDEYFQYLDQPQDFFSPAMEQITRDWLIALSRRVFARFALPSQLAGYLLMIYPLNILLLFRERNRWAKLWWGGVLVLNSIIFFYTKSFGAWLSFVVIVGFVAYGLISRKRKITWLTLGKGIVVLGIGGWLLVYLLGSIRGQHLWDFQGNNPLWYRWLNWKAALRMFLDHPFLGTGFHTYGKMYPQYMLPGANESQYVHNTYLQFGSELGLLGMLLVIWLVGQWGKASLPLLKRWGPDDSQKNTDDQRVATLYGICFFLSGLAFLLHNVIDFDFYVFPLGALGVSLLALMMNVLSPDLPERQRNHKDKPRNVVAVYRIMVCCLLLVIYVIDWRSVYGQHYHDRVVTALQSSQYEDAETAIRQALQYSPHVPEYLALEGNILLYRHEIIPALQRFASAIQQEPDTPWFHAGLAEAYLTDHNLSLAYLESRRANELFPQKVRYQQLVQTIQAVFPKSE